MKKILLFIITIFVLIIGACASTNTPEELQSKIWNVVATNGEAYTAEFAKDTATFKMGEFYTVGMGYEINGDEITLEDKHSEKHTFIIEKNKGEYIFKAKTDEVRDRFGDLTLSPKLE